MIPLSTELVDRARDDFRLLTGRWPTDRLMAKWEQAKRMRDRWMVGNVPMDTMILLAMQDMDEPAELPTPTTAEVIEASDQEPPPVRRRPGRPRTYPIPQKAGVADGRSI